MAPENKQRLKTEQNAEYLKFEKKGRCGFVRLDRPQALNALNLDMFRQMQEQYEAWRKDPHIYAIVQESTSKRAFSAGGDIRALYEAGREDPRLAIDLMRREYPHYWWRDRFSKSVVSLMDGLLMGGGAGIVIYAPHRLVGENFSFAMPETGIGFFPDVGAGFFMNRFPGFTGTYLALTGKQVGPSDAYYLGFASHCIPRQNFEVVRQAMIEAEPMDPVIDNLHVDFGASELKHNRSAIDAVFSADTMEEIFSRLAALPGNQQIWARETVEILNRKSPFSLKLTLRLMQQARGRGLRYVLQQDFRLALNCLRHEDFYEGVRALIIDKDNKPRWRHKSIEDVDDDLINSFFAPVGEELILESYQEGVIS